MSAELHPDCHSKTRQWRNDDQCHRVIVRELALAGAQLRHGSKTMRCRLASPGIASYELRVLVYSWLLFPFCLVAAPTAQRLVGRSLILETFPPVGIAQIDSITEGVGAFFERFQPPLESELARFAPGLDRVVNPQGTDSDRYRGRGQRRHRIIEKPGQQENDRAHDQNIDRHRRERAALFLLIVGLQDLGAFHNRIPSGDASGSTLDRNSTEGGLVARSSACFHITTATNEPRFTPIINPSSRYFSRSVMRFSFVRRSDKNGSARPRGF